MRNPCRPLPMFFAARSSRRMSQAKRGGDRAVHLERERRAAIGVLAVERPSVERIGKKSIDHPGQGHSRRSFPGSIFGSMPHGSSENRMRPGGRQFCLARERDVISVSWRAGLSSPACAWSARGQGLTDRQSEVGMRYLFTDGSDGNLERPRELAARRRAAPARATPPSSGTARAPWRRCTEPPPSACSPSTASSPGRACPAASCSTMSRSPPRCRAEPSSSIAPRRPRTARCGRTCSTSRARRSISSRARSRPAGPRSPPRRGPAADSILDPLWLHMDQYR